MAVKVTTKKPKTINSRSKALNIFKRKQKPNKQVKTINGQKVIITAREAKNLK